MGEAQIVLVSLASVAIVAAALCFTVRPLLRLRTHPDDAPILRQGHPDDVRMAVPVSRVYHLRQGPLAQIRSVSGARPALTIARDGLRYRTLREDELPYSSIEQIDVRRGLFGGAHILFLSERNRHVLAAHIPDTEAARRALVALPRDLPLSTHAAILRDGSPAAAAPGLKRYRGAFR